jgi:hypothetical protein
MVLLASTFMEYQRLLMSYKSIGHKGIFEKFLWRDLILLANAELSYTPVSTSQRVYGLIP